MKKPTQMTVTVEKNRFLGEYVNMSCNYSRWKIRFYNSILGYTKIASVVFVGDGDEKSYNSSKNLERLEYIHNVH